MREEPNLYSGRGVAGGMLREGQPVSKTCRLSMTSIPWNQIVRSNDNKLKIHSVHGAMHCASVHQDPHRQGIDNRGRILGYYL